jgi:hypothetical protein
MTLGVARAARVEGISCCRRARVSALRGTTHRAICPMIARPRSRLGRTRRRRWRFTNSSPPQAPGRACRPGDDEDVQPHPPAGTQSGCGRPRADDRGDTCPASGADGRCQTHGAVDEGSVTRYVTKPPSARLVLRFAKESGRPSWTSFATGREGWHEVARCWTICGGNAGGGARDQSITSLTVTYPSRIPSWQSIIGACVDARPCGNGRRMAYIG